jgi:ABC-type antimicrobial peptide transport system permease subunit
MLALALDFGDIVGSNVAGERLVARLLLTFGALALLLGAVGVYSVTAFAVARRTAELGVRSALGADARTLLAMVLAESVRDAGFGVAVGVALTLAAGRVAASHLPGIEVTDPFALAGAALVLALIAVLAAAVPAWRAARVDPARTLRRG